MPAGRKGTNVELRGNDIRIRFTWNRKRYCEPISRRPTKANEKWAIRHADDVRRAIHNGTFSFEHFFPDSKHCVAAARTGDFAHYEDLWLSAKSGLADATRQQYKLSLATWKKRELRKGVRLASVPLADVRHSELAALVGAVEWPSAHMRNNSLIPLRGIFEMWVADDRRHRDNPMEGVENASFQKGKPDPWTLEQAEAIITRAYEKYPEQVGAYIEFAIFTFVRPEEEIAIAWPKVDQVERRVRIDVAKTFRGTMK